MGTLPLHISFPIERNYLFLHPIELVFSERKLLLWGDIRIHQETLVKFNGDVTNFQQSSYDDSPLYGYQMSLICQLSLVINLSSKLVTAAVEF